MFILGLNKFLIIFRLIKFVIYYLSNKVEDLQSVYEYKRKTLIKTNQVFEMNVCQDGKRLW